MRGGENKKRIFGEEIYHFSVVDSTNKIAFSLAEGGKKEGTVVVANQQIKGEGRRGRSWFSPPGGLWFSIILHPSSPPVDTFIYPLMAALAIVRVIEKKYSLFTYISWPNDVMLEGKKIGGTMCKIKAKRGKVEFAILGVGVNLNVEHFPPSLSNLATSLLLETGRIVYPFYFLDLFLKVFESLYLRYQQTWSKGIFFFEGEPVKIVIPEREEMMYVRGINPSGNLILGLKDSTQIIINSRDFSSLSCFNNS